MAAWGRFALRLEGVFGGSWVVLRLHCAPLPVTKEKEQTASDRSNRGYANDHARGNTGRIRAFGWFMCLGRYGNGLSLTRSGRHDHGGSFGDCGGWFVFGRVGLRR